MQRTPSQKRMDRRGTRRPRRGFTARGFTLVELLVAVAAVGLLVVGIGAIFAAVGDTVQGGQRVSRLTQQAATIERVLREDIANLSTDGVLVIRHGFADDPNMSGVQAFPLDAATGIGLRPRRADQMVYTTIGRTTSSRLPLNSAGPLAQAPTADVSLVYVGHGLRWATDDGEVEVDDDPETYGNAAHFGDLLNASASRWTLLRRPVLLRPPAPPDPDTTYLDNEIQIGAQPAVSSVFRSMASQLPQGGDLPAAADLLRGDAIRPSLASGVVDVASMGLSDMMRLIRYGNFRTSVQGGEYVLAPPAVAPTSGGVAATNPLRNTQEWMQDLFPAAEPFGSGGGFDDVDRGDWRMRYEPTPADLFGTRQNNGTPWVQNEDYRLADQLMLSSANFVPNCSEFIVEWSFGDTVIDPTTNRPVTLWHGRDRFTADDDVLAVRYGGSPDAPNGYQVGDLPLWTSPVYPKQGNPDAGTFAVAQRLWPLNPLVVHGRNPNLPIPATNPRAVYSFFGSVDPSYEPTLYDSSHPENWPAQVEWPWPRMLRVTMTLADPEEPGVEQTFQFIFELPRKEQPGL